MAATTAEHPARAMSHRSMDAVGRKARDEWVPLFQNDATNGHPEGPTGAVADTTASIEEAAAEAGAASGEATDQAATDTAEAINEAYDSVDREAT